MAQRRAGNAPEQQRSLPTTQKPTMIVVPVGSFVEEKPEEISFFLTSPNGGYQKLTFRFEDYEVISGSQTQVSSVPPTARELKEKQTLLFSADTENGIGSTSLTWVAPRAQGDFTVRRFVGDEANPVARREEVTEQDVTTSARIGKNNRQADERANFNLAADLYLNFVAAYPNATAGYTKASADAQAAYPKGGMVGQTLLANSISLVRYPEAEQAKWITRAQTKGGLSSSQVRQLLRGQTLPQGTTVDTQDLHALAKSLAHLRKSKLDNEANAKADALIASLP